MKPKDILRKIVEHDGSCEWVSPGICDHCPIGSMYVSRNGKGWMNCVEAVGAQNMTEKEANARYKEVASSLLAAEALEEALFGETEEEDEPAIEVNDDGDGGRRE